MDILSTISARIPGTLLPDSTILEGYLLKWKYFIAPVLNPSIPESSLADDNAWPHLGAELLVSLVIYEVLDIAIKSFMLSATSASSSSSGTPGLVKRVVTGPAEAEYFSPKETMAEVVKPGGLFQSTKDSVCMLAARLSVSLYICENSNKVVMAPDVHRKHRR